MLLDQFTTADDSPVTSPRTCEPGPGTLTFVQLDGTFAISGGKLAFTAQTTPTNGDLGLYGAGVGREAGRVLLCSIDHTGIFFFAWAVTASCNFDGFGNMEHGLILYGNDIYSAEAGANVRIVAADVAGAQVYAIVLRQSGAFILRDSTLLWVSNTKTVETVYPSLSNYNAVGTADDFRIPQQLWTPTPLVSDSFNRADSTDLGVTDGLGAEETGGSGVAWVKYGLATTSIASNKLSIIASSGSGAKAECGSADIVASVTLTTGTGGYSGMAVRHTDATHEIEVLLANTDNEVQIWELSETPTKRGGTAVTIADSTSYTLLVVCDGATVNAYMNGGSYTTGTVTQTTATTHALYSESCTTLFDSVAIWNRTQTPPNF